MAPEITIGIWNLEFEVNFEQDANPLHKKKQILNEWLNMPPHFIIFNIQSTTGFQMLLKKVQWRERGTLSHHFIKNKESDHNRMH